MREVTTIKIDFPKKATSLPKIKTIFRNLKDDGVLVSCIGVMEKKNHIASYQYVDLVPAFPLTNELKGILLDEKIPFNLVYSESTDSQRINLIYREDMEAPLRFCGEQQSVPVDSIRSILDNPGDLRQHLTDFLDLYYPKQIPLDKAVKLWEERTNALGVAL